MRNTCTKIIIREKILFNLGVKKYYSKYFTICFLFFGYQILFASESNERLNWPIEHLFHGSPTHGIKKLIPNKLKRRTKNDKAYIYSSPSMAYASTFTLSWDDSWCKLFTLEDGVFLYTKDVRRLKKNDHGGSLYIMSSTNFHQSLMHDYEFLSETPLTVQTEIVFDSSLKAMSQFGVKLFSVNEEIFETLADKSYAERLKILEQYEIDYETL